MKNESEVDDMSNIDTFKRGIQLLRNSRIYESRKKYDCKMSRRGSKRILSVWGSVE